MIFKSLNLYTDKGDLLMIPSSSLERNPACKLVRGTGNIHVFCFDIKPENTYKVRLANGEVCEKENLKRLPIITHIEFETNDKRALFSIKNSRCKYQIKADNSLSIIIKGDK